MSQFTPARGSPQRPTPPSWSGRGTATGTPMSAAGRPGAARAPPRPTARGLEIHGPLQQGRTDARSHQRLHAALLEREGIQPPPRRSAPPARPGAALPLAKISPKSFREPGFAILRVLGAFPGFLPWFGPPFCVPFLCPSGRQILPQKFLPLFGWKFNFTGLPAPAPVPLFQAHFRTFDFSPERSAIFRAFAAPVLPPCIPGPSPAGLSRNSPGFSTPSQPFPWSGKTRSPLPVGVSSTVGKSVSRARPRVRGKISRPFPA